MKSYHGGIIGSHQRSFERYHPRPRTASSPKIGGSQLQAKTAIAIISGTGKAADCKFGRYIHRVHPNKSLTN